MRYLFFFIAFAFELSAQSVVFSPDMLKGIPSVAELRYADLQGLLNKERLARPDNRVPDYLEAASICVRVFFVEDEAYYEKQVDRLDALFERIEDLPDSNPYKRVFLAELSLARAGVYGKFKHNVKAGWLFYRAYNLLKDNLNDFPDFIPTLIPYGVLQTAVGSLPEDYKSIASLFGFQGNIEEGLSMIRKAYYYSLADPKLKFHQDYFGFVYAYVNYELETDEQVSLRTLDMKVDQSSFFAYLEAQQLLRKGETKEALEVMLNRPKGKNYLHVPYFDYYTGKIALMLGHPQAPEFLQNFLDKTKDKEHLKSTYRYLAWHHLIGGNAPKAEEYRQKILAQSESLTGSDKQAQQEAEMGFNVYLIEARLDFDAGRYTQLVKTLHPDKEDDYCRNDIDRQEFYYRRGRALQELGFKEKALQAFLKVQALPASATYAWGNSILQCAQIYEEKGNYNLSRNFYKKALKYKDYAFHEGVHQKARAGLERIP